jgi:hypothetical protein
MGAPFTEAENSNHSQDGADNNEEHLSKPPAMPSATEDSLSTYLSLVTQYLSVFMNDNATFLAERCVAQHPSSAEARYMLALCYFRSGAFQRTLLTLARQTKPTPAMRFLAAQAALQIKDYTRAEDVLLKDCRMAYQKILRENNNNADATSARNMDDWILQTTVSDSVSAVFIDINQCETINSLFLFFIL